MGGVTIAAASGIFKEHDYTRGHFERMPYNESEMRSIYHTRQFDITKLSLMDSPTVFVSHDWPLSIERYGDLEWLLHAKPFFREEVERNALGSPPLWLLLQKLKPRYWFSAHLHVKYSAQVVHSTGSNEEELDIGDSDDEEVSVSPGHEQTDFVALSKCMRRGGFLHFFDVPSPEDMVLNFRGSGTRPEVSLRYNKRWLAITHALQPYFSLTYRQARIPPFEELCKAVDASAKHLQDRTTSDLLDDPLDVRTVQTFEFTAPPHSPVIPGDSPRAYLLTSTAI